MKKNLWLIKQLKNQRGVTAIIVAVLIVGLLGFVALLIDIGYALVTRNELQNISDAAALAAARELSEQYKQEDFDPFDPGDLVPIKGVAEDIASKNQAGGKSITIDENDVIIGVWDSSATPRFDRNPTPPKMPNAVKVTARRDDTPLGLANGSITTFFAQVLGIPSVSVRATATAALTGPSESKTPIPVGISEYWFTHEPYCDQDIQFYPTNDVTGCAAWCTYTSLPPSASKLSKILTALAAGKLPLPDVPVGTEFAFIGGTLASCFDAMEALFNAMRVKNDGVLDLDTDPLTWTTYVPVYDWDDCSNPNKSIPIVGFAEVTIREIVGAPEKKIVGRVICEEIIPDTRGGGSYYGAWGEIPGLVE